MPGEDSFQQSPETGRLQATFQNHPLSSHGVKWDSLWVEAYTPWDRGGPSAALEDLLSGRADLFPGAGGRGGGPDCGEAEAGEKKLLKALVPGCGRGYDALLLAAHGYDVYGLDYSAAATREAVEAQAKVGGEDVYRTRGDGEGVGRGQRGKVTWLTGDFFDEAWLTQAGIRSFDLIFDYTFFCALPPDARPKWAKRMTELLTRDGGRLVCLEWPLHKSPASGGPPWGLTTRMYKAHLSRPGEEFAYGPNGRLIDKDAGQQPPAEDGLSRLVHIKPHRTHRAGYDSQGGVIDFISVWRH